MLSVASWAVLGVTSASTLTPTRLAITLLHVSVAFAIWRRGPVEQLGSPLALLSSVPALVIAGTAFRLAAPLATWPCFLEILFAAGAALAIWTFMSMGESFSVLPARRSIVTRGPYHWVRHPAYAGELTMIVACVLSAPSWASGAVLVAAVPCVALRILAEERLLGSSDAYLRYRARVPARLIPCLW